jgi:hypothetical protein
VATRKVTGKANLAAPWDAAPVDPADILAIQALVAGTANADQQRRVVLWIEAATGVTDWAFRPGQDGQRATDLALGKQWVGKQFFTLARAYLPPSR